MMAEKCSIYMVANRNVARHKKRKIFYSCCHLTIFTLLVSGYFAVTASHNRRATDNSPDLDNLKWSTFSTGERCIRTQPAPPTATTQKLYYEKKKKNNNNANPQVAICGG